MILNRIGSPPQVRGKPLRSQVRYLTHRITPAGAGKTAYCSCFLARCWDHPRRCGENLPKSSRKVLYKGSPPQVRGKLRDCHRTRPQERITPAGAGKTPSCTTFAPLVQDHPRRCGENTRKSAMLSAQRGSPPQVRGKPVLDCPACAAGRITPAGAGKTLHRCRQSRQHRDHPRRCGENIDNLPLLLDAVGSPPQVRGKLCQCCLRRPRSRITPAGAGKTVLGTDRRTAAEDHPRRCGEND